jgi:glycosyltransferase involved in cell wall biosynthesis
VQALVDWVPVLAPELRFLFMKHPRGPERLSPADNVRECVVPQEANGPATLLWLRGIIDLRGVALYHNTFGIMPYAMPVKTVVSVPDIMQITHPSWAKGPEPWGWIEVGFKWWGVTRALSKADRIVTVSEATKREIAAVDPAAAARTHVALQGVAEDFHVMKGEEGKRLIESVRRRYVQGAERYILAVGQFSIYKNHETILRSFAQAFGGDSDVHLVFVQRLGSGPRVLRPIAKELGVDARVHFVRDLPLVDLVALYNGAVALSHPSLYEGFGNPISEAIACGCPVVTSDRVSMPEVAAGSALLVNPEDAGEVADAIRRVAEDKALAKEMRRKGLARAAELTWESFARKHVEVYRDVIAGTGG